MAPAEKIVTTVPRNVPESNLQPFSLLSQLSQRFSKDSFYFLKGFVDEILNVIYITVDDSLAAFRDVFESGDDAHQFADL